jgi:hypothetical protein
LDAWTDIVVGGFGDIAAAVVAVAAAVVAGIDSWYFRYFRFHPCTKEIAAVVDSPDWLALS